MLRFLATLACVVAVVWVLSYFAAPAFPEVEGRDISPLDPEPPAFVAPLAPAPAGEHHEHVAAAHKLPHEKVEKIGKGKKGGKGRR